MKHTFLCLGAAAHSPLTKPSDGVAMLLIVGEELAFIGAFMFMAATFRHNARTRGRFNGFGFAISAIGAAFILSGTIGSLGALDWKVKVAAGAGLLAALVAFKVAFWRSRRLPHFSIGANQIAGDDPPNGAAEDNEGANAIDEDPQRDEAEEEQRRVIGSQLGESCGERRDRITRRDRYGVARHVVILQASLLLCWLSRTATRRLLATVRARIRARGGPIG